ncbi:MAG: cell division protein CrgA [Propionibacteriaceae bacterium]|nr:cell division protein CrgA [Propionibacteriaceae bacterium]
MPESRIRKEAAEKKKQTTKASVQAKKAKKAAAPGTGSWVVPTFLTLLILGIVWLVVYYVTASLGIRVPVISVPESEGGLGGWNIIIGMALIAASFIVSTQWGKKG